MTGGRNRSGDKVTVNSGDEGSRIARAGAHGVLMGGCHVARDEWRVVRCKILRGEPSDLTVGQD